MQIPPPIPSPSSPHPSPPTKSMGGEGVAIRRASAMSHPLRPCFSGGEGWGEEGKHIPNPQVYYLLQPTDDILYSSYHDIYKHF